MNRLRHTIGSEMDIHFMKNEIDKAMESITLSDHDKIRLSTILSELAYNQIKYAGKGSIETIFQIPYRKIIITAKDRGPGIADIELALKDNYSTSGTLGLGLPGIKRFADDFFIESEVNNGTKVRVELWLKE